MCISFTMNKISSYTGLEVGGGGVSRRYAVGRMSWSPPTGVGAGVRRSESEGRSYRRSYRQPEVLELAMFDKSIEQHFHYNSKQSAFHISHFTMIIKKLAKI